ncbi:MAG: selenoprotein B, partial [bacterium]|nr:selenoprotein B [bacterium]
MATTQISLIREHTERIRPPRALWVPFEFGRPFGAPGQSEFQDRVLRAALELLQRPTGPVLEDFPEDAPAGAPPQVPLACPVSFATTNPSPDDETALFTAFQAEVEGLRNWYDIAVQSRGRTTADTAGMPPEAVADFIAIFARGEKPSEIASDVALSASLKMASEDLKAYYTEAITAQPGRATDAASLADWFWGETA